MANIVSYNGAIMFDASKPDGSPQKLLDSSRLNSLGWEPSVGLEEGLGLAYEDFRKRCHCDVP